MCVICSIHLSRIILNLSKAKNRTNKQLLTTEDDQRYISTGCSSVRLYLLSTATWRMYCAVIGLVLRVKRKTIRSIGIKVRYGVAMPKSLPRALYCVACCCATCRLCGFVSWPFDIRPTADSTQ